MSDAPTKITTPNDQRAQARAATIKAAKWIGAEFADLSRKDRTLLAKLFRIQLIPPGRPGRKRCQGITAAHSDWKKGSRGVSLYQNHIPHFDQMSLWRRRCEIRRLLDAIRNRERRVAKPVDDDQQADRGGQ